MSDVVVTAIISGVLAFAGGWGGVKVHLYYLRRDVDHALRSARSAHHRLDRINAPPAPWEREA